MNEQPSGPPRPSPAVPWKLVALSLGVAAVACALLVALSLSWLPRGERLPIERAALDDFGPAPSFSLVDQAGRSVRLDDLRGTPWVANFVFTRCPSICPTLTRRMHELQERTADLGGRLRLVSFSVDPAHDRPEVLARYADEHGADTDRWAFLTSPDGSVEPIADGVVPGFSMSLAGTGPDARPEEIEHGPWFVLVDAEGRIRSHHDTSRPGELEELAAFARRLALAGSTRQAAR